MKKIFALLLAVCMLLSLVACRETPETSGKNTVGNTTGGPVEEETVTIYVVTERKQYVDGALSNHTVVTYDDKARPLTITQEEIGVQTKEIALTYDEYGNRTQKATTTTMAGRGEPYQYQTDYTLTYTDGLLTHCEKPYKDAFLGMDFVYDEAGRLTVIQFDEIYTELAYACWIRFTYDDQGRLAEETLCKRQTGNREIPYYYFLTRIRYSYGDDGRLSAYSLSSHRSDTPVSAEASAQVAFENEAYERYYFYYDQAGRLAYVMDTPLENYDGSSAAIYSNTAYSFDEHGNLVREDYGAGNYTQYSYAAFELKKSEAKLARRLSHGITGDTEDALQLDPLYWRLSGGKSFSHFFDMQGCHPFYYLLDYAQWDVWEAEAPVADQPDPSMKAIYLLAEEWVAEYKEFSTYCYPGTTNIYGGEGRLLYRETSTSGSVSAWQAETDEYGRITRLYREVNGTIHSHEYTYDDRGNVLRLDKYIGTHLQNQEVNTYDENGNLLTQEQWIGDKMTFIEYTYENGLLVLKTTFYDGVETEKVTYGYDSQGRLVTETPDSGSWELHYTYSEDGKTRRIEGSRFGTVTIETVDEHGNLIRVETIGKNSRTVREYTYHIIYVPADYPRTNWS